MFQLLRKLQQKPAAKRRRISFGIALALTLIIFVVWGSTFAFRTSNDESIGNPEIGPFDSFERALKGIFN